MPGSHGTGQKLCVMEESKGIIEESPVEAATETNENNEKTEEIREGAKDTAKRSERAKALMPAFAEGLVFLAVVFLQWLALEASMTSLGEIFWRSLLATLMNYCIILAVNALVAVATGRTAMALMITSSFFSVITIVNFYLNQIHGSPLRISEIKNIATAANVISSYQITVPPTVIILFAVFLIELAAVIVARRFIMKKYRGWRTRIAALALLIISVTTVWLSFGGERKPVIGWSWSYAASTYGYPACLVEDTLAFITKYEEPQGYSAERVDDIGKTVAPDEPKDGGYSDIILILNETFYDPKISRTLDVETDRPYLSYFYGIENVARGYTAVPLTGTNATEYELLTSNSCSMINPSAPFNFIPMKDQNSVTSYLKGLGYETWAMHDAENTNYNRNTAYPNMGFDHILFMEDFEEIAAHGNRPRTDSADYRQLFKAYESSGDGPRFIYMLTYQNHGGYEQNGDEYDTVHVLNDLGEYTDDANEFLTSISMSDSALEELLDYFRGVDRHVTIAMIGDHPPVFASSIMESNTTEDRIYNNMTPYFVWSNYKELSTEHDCVTASDIVPMALKAGDVPLSKYYSYILDMQTLLPARNKLYAVDPDGALITIAEDEEANEVWTDYLCLEYNNVKSSSERRQELFDPPAN